VHCLPVVTLKALIPTQEAGLPSTARYFVKTGLSGLVIVPLMVSGAVALATAPASGATVWSMGIATPVAMLVAFVFWAARAHGDDRPDHWLPALLPVAVVPALFLLFWVVAYAATGGLGDTLNVFATVALPYLILSFSILLTGQPLVMPVTLAAVLLASVAGFVRGARQSGPLAGRRVVAGVVAACIGLVGVAVFQLGERAATASMLTGKASMGDEIELYEYQPFRPGNKLVTPDREASLRIATDLPKLDGATALFPVYAAIAQATFVRPDGLDEEGGYQFDEHYLCSTTPGAYDRLIAGEADAIFVAQPSTGQLAKAKASRVELTATPIGREAFVFFVNTGNPVTNLTLDQVRDIYSKRITNWNQVGGPDEAIIAFQRPEDSGSQTAMLAMVMKDRAMAQPMKEERISGMGGVISEVAGYRDLTGAIGYSFRWYATVMNANPDIRLLTIDGVEPTAANIRNGSYPLTGEVNIVTAGSTNPNVSKLIDWSLSAEGQALIEKTGYVGR
jgi:phosphate transport system substrate-binding protein